MNKALSDTIEFVTGKQTLKQISQKEVQDIIAAYPYFAPAQLVYAAKLRADNSYQVQTQVQKAGLYFNNARWLQYQLIDVSVDNFKTIEKETTPINAVDREVKIVEKDSHIQHNEITVNNETTVENVIAEKIDFIASLNIPTVEEVKNIMSGIDETNEPKVVIEKIETYEHSTTLEESVTDNFNIEESIELPVKNLIQENDETHINTNVEQYTPTTDETEFTNKIEVEDNDIHSQIAALKANWHKNHHQDNYQEVVSNESKIESVENKIEHITVDNNIIQEKVIEAKIEIPSLRADWDKPKEDFANALLPFETEPYYTIDYFASQGIKFDYTKEPHDKLTTKMLKFTDWLKKMKNVTPENIIVEEDPELDKAIVNIATASNQSKEIVTETMAEIFAKQGKKEKAIQLYIKLSFLLPDKTAYFAAKIKELKGI